MAPELSPEKIQEYWQLYVKRMSDNYREEYEVNPDILWESFKKELIRNGLCPKKDPHGVPQFWRGRCRGKEMEDNKKIREQCQAGDEIEMDSEMTGG